MSTLSWLLLHRGHIRATSYSLVIGVWGSVSAVVALTNGVLSPMVTAYPILILATGWLLSPIAAVAMACASIVGVFGLAVGEMSGALTMLKTTPLLLAAGVISIVFTIAASVVVSVMRLNERRIAQLRRVGHELSQRSRELELAQKELTEAQTVASMGSWVYDFKTDVFRMSAEACRILELPAGTTGTLARCASVVHADDLAQTRQAWEAAKVSGFFVAEFRLQVGTQVRWLRAKAEFTTPTGAHWVALGVSQDITERKQFETDLMAAKAEAEEATKAKSTFLAAVSHDLGQPLSALSLMLSVLKKRAPENNPVLLQKMQGCVDGMSGLLADLMEVSKLDAGVVLPQPTIFSIHDLLATVVPLHSVQAQMKGLDLRVRASPIVIHTDFKLMQRILGNLVTNALRYTATGGVLVATRLHAGKQWLEVWDTGIGIAPEQRSVVFEEFTQIHTATRNHGNGLGLSIVARIARLLGLQIRLQSRPGKGSLFAVELPRRSAPAVAIPTATTSPTGKRRIALVDDNAVLLESLVLALEGAHYDVVAASNTQELLERLGTTGPEVIVSDYQLADGETGMDVINSVRQVFGTDTRCLIITADTGSALSAAMAEKHIPVLYNPLDVAAFQALLLSI